MTKKLNGIYSHKSDNWKTPKSIYDFFINHKFIDTFKYESKENEFEKNYRHKNLFCNPPYSQMLKVADWICYQGMMGNKIALLVPARTDTKWFHRICNYCQRDLVIFFIKGRLKFGNSKNSAPFPSILILINSGHYKRNEFILVNDSNDLIKRVYDWIK